MATTPLDFAINIILCALTSIILMLAYVRFSRSLSGRYHIGHVIPLLALITFLVIMVVKSSIALSLEDLQRATRAVVSAECHPMLGTVRYEVDSSLSKAVGSFPTTVACDRALALGLSALT